ncbi:MAG TPA: S-methyl-5-thioribose-1-phosphate isomerase [Candidatus Aminicenantes bacterium]|nr:S-methyl-5-thioribose-1-phosphate isomerase [Candidatus Aminicenantes bacterium]
MWPSLAWKGQSLTLIDQRLLPHQEIYTECRTGEEVAQAIEKMVIRGAPAIGVAAAYGVVLAIQKSEDKKSLQGNFECIISRLKQTRPTARNLFWALERMEQTFKAYYSRSVQEIIHRLEEEAQLIEKEDVETNRQLGDHGASLIPAGSTVLTHCNAGALATAGYGTALGVVRTAFAQGKIERVYACETRPFLQGARLTCWELAKENIPVILITDNMAGWLMKQGKISLVITGADRIAGNGDAANKIGTYSLAVLAREHHLPFYVAAPLSTFDFSLRTGQEIPIEERDPREVRELNGQLISLKDIPVENPAFDVTPASYITAIISERGVAYPPYSESLPAWSKRGSCP